MSVVISQQNVPSNKTADTAQKLADVGWEVLTHLLNIPDPAPSHFHVFGFPKESPG